MIEVIFSLLGIEALGGSFITGSSHVGSRGRGR
jgi:hypothetical protein